MRKTLDIGIAGAGPAGLATALYLTRLGHRVHLFERFATPRPLGSGLILQPAGLAVLHDLGLGDAMIARGQPLDRLKGTDAETGRVVLDVRYNALKKLGRGLGVHRAALFDVLYDRAVAAGIEVHGGTTISGFEHDAGRSRVVANGRRLGPFDLVVDCLGANSPLKPFAKLPDRVQPLAYGALWATLPWVERGFDRTGLLQRYQRASVMIGVLPVGSHEAGGPPLAAFFWSLRTADHAALVAAGLEAWKARVHRLWPETAPHLETIEDFDALILARYAHHTLRVPAGEGLVFAGDSAHAASPQLGQGANMALLDARALFVALRDGEDVPEAIARYCGLRRWHVRLYQLLSQMFTPFYQSDSRFLPMIRDLLVSNLARVPPAPQILAAMVAGAILNPIKSLELSAPPEH